MDRIGTVICGIVFFVITGAFVIYTFIHLHKSADDVMEEQYYASQICDICGEPTAGKTIYQIKGERGLFGGKGTSLLVYNKSDSPEEFGETRTAFICEDCIGKVNVNLNSDNVTEIAADGKTVNVVTIPDGNDADAAGERTEGSSEKGKFFFTELPAGIAGFCTECGTPYTEGSKFCSSCGTALRTAAVQ